MTACRKINISLESVLLGRLSDITCPDSLLETVGHGHLLLVHGFNVTGCRYHTPAHSIRPEPVERHKLRPMIDRAKHPSTPLRMNQDGTRQSH